MERRYFVYILTNYGDTVLYTGVTNDLFRRIQEHRAGVAEDSFTKRYRLYKLIWTQEFTSSAEAIAAEKMIKGWKREKKLALIRETNPGFRDLLSE